MKVEDEPMGKMGADEDYDPISSPGGPASGKLVSFLIYYLIIWPLWTVATLIAGIFIAEELTSYLVLAWGIVGLEIFVIILIIKFWPF